jgi:hypothetical protein
MNKGEDEDMSSRSFTRNLCWLTALAGLAFSIGLKAETTDDWQDLLAGNSLDAWRNYQSDSVSSGWTVQDGILKRSGRRAGDLVTRQQYADFELELEWRVETGGNSGIFFRATEDEKRIYMSAPEVQILDDNHHKDGSSPLTSAGSNYGLHPAPRGIARSAGAWNEVRLKVVGNHVTQWLNSQQIVDYTLGSEDWRKRVADSKFSAWPAYGKATRGHIGLQDHGDPVAFRNIRIRVLDPES